MTVPSFLHSYARPAAGAEAFIAIVSGQGAEVVDDAGNRYVDALASLWYCAVGHGRDEIVDAVTIQMRKLEAFHTFDRFTNEPAEAVADTLRRLAPMPEARVFFTCSGSEAVDSALKLARLAHHAAGEPARTLVISRRPSYHGVTFGGMTATGLPANQEGFGPLVGDMVQVPYDDLESLDAVLAENPGRLAAIIAEPVVGAGGVYPPTDGYLAALRERCDRHGGLLVADEVICGFGRLGQWWGMQHYRVVPDLVTFAKGVTSGYQPLGGVLVGPEVRRRLEADTALVLRHGHTYSAHPTACAAAVANLAILERERLWERAEPIGQRLAQGLRGVVDGDAALGVRGQGGVWAIALGQGVGAVDVREELLLRGVIARPIGAATVAFCPPLVISDHQIDQCVEATAEAVRTVAKAR